MKVQAILSSLLLTPAVTAKVVTEFQAFKKLLSEKSSAPIERTEPTVHNLKVWTPYFEQISNGSKPFEARKNDRGFKVGDTLRLSEYNPLTETYTGRVLFATVTYILEGGRFGLKRGFVVMGIKPLSNEFKTEEVEHYKEMYEAERRHVKQLMELNRVLLQQITALQIESVGFNAIDMIELNKTLGTDLPVNLNKLN